MKKYKMSDFSNLMTEEEVNEIYYCNYCSETLIDDGFVRKDWFLFETQYGDYCCEKEDCVWQYVGEHTGSWVNEEIEDKYDFCENCEEKEQMEESDLCSKCDDDMQSAVYDEQQELLRKGQE